MSTGRVFKITVSDQTQAWTTASCINRSPSVPVLKLYMVNCVTALSPQRTEAPLMSRADVAPNTDPSCQERLKPKFCHSVSSVSQEGHGAHLIVQLKRPIA